MARWYSLATRPAHEHQSLHAITNPIQCPPAAAASVKREWEGILQTQRRQGLFKQQLNSECLGLLREGRTLVREAKRQQLAEDDLALAKSELLFKMTGVSEEVQRQVTTMRSFRATFRAMFSVLSTRSSLRDTFANAVIDSLGLACIALRCGAELSRGVRHACYEYYEPTTRAHESGIILRFRRARERGKRRLMLTELRQ